MSFHSIWPAACKRLRRSIRLISREKDDSRMQRVEAAVLGYFELLPPELIYRIFMYLSVENLSVLTICSKALRSKVEIYLNSLHGLKLLIPNLFSKKGECSLSQAAKEENIGLFRKLGLLMKRATCLYPTKDRLRIVLHFINKMECSPEESTNYVTHILQCYGKFVHTLIAGWDESECHFVHAILETVSHMKKHVPSILQSTPGTHCIQEMYVRKYYRLVYLDFCHSAADRTFWLSRILKPMPFVYQAKFLYLLFGPVCTDAIKWWELVETTPSSLSQAHEYLLDLAQAVRLLQRYSTEWSEDDLISIIQELTDTPEEWISENVATLLFLCGDAVAIMFLGNKILNGKILELATLVANLAVVCTKYSFSIKWLIHIIECVCKITENEDDRERFIDAIPNVFHEAILDLRETSEIDYERDADLRLLVETQNAFLSVILKKAFGQNISDALFSEG